MSKQPCGLLINSLTVYTLSTTPVFVNVNVRFWVAVLYLIILSFLTSHLDVTALVANPFLGSDVLTIVFVQGPQLSSLPAVNEAVGFGWIVVNLFSESIQPFKFVTVCFIL